MNERTITVKPKVWLGEQVADAVRAAVEDHGASLWKISVEMGHSVGWGNQAVKDRRLNGLIEILDHLGYDIEVRTHKRD